MHAVLLVVSIYLLYKCLSFIWIFIRYTESVKGVLSKRHDLKRAGEWAIITGGTDGIGKAFAEELARDGLNIFIISRNPNKLYSVAQELEKSFNVQTKTFAADFTKADFYEALRREIDGLSSVSCLVNNVGASQVCAGPTGTCEFLSVEFIQRLVLCNITSTACMTRITIPKMLSQSSLCPPCVISMSSVSGIYPRPFKSLYAAVKAFVHHFCASMAAESTAPPFLTAPAIRFLTLTPGFVWTPSRGEKKTNFFIPTPEVFARSALDMIGVASECCGFMSHELMVAGMSLLPDCLRDWVVANFEWRQRLKYLATLQKAE